MFDICLLIDKIMTLISINHLTYIKKYKKNQYKLSLLYGRINIKRILILINRKRPINIL